MIQQQDLEMGSTMPVRSGEYWVSDIACSCPDWQYRGARSGIACKHMVAWHRGQRFPPRPPKPVEEVS